MHLSVWHQKKNFIHVSVNMTIKNLKGFPQTDSETAETWTGHWSELVLGWSRVNTRSDPKNQPIQTNCEEEWRKPSFNEGACRGHSCSRWVDVNLWQQLDSNIMLSCVCLFQLKQFDSQHEHVVLSVKSSPSKGDASVIQLFLSFWLFNVKMHV